MSDFSIIAGDSKTLEITVQEDGAAVDLSGSAIIWEAARQPFGVTVITKAGSITAAAEGKFEIALEPADTAALNGNFYHSAKITKSADVSTIFLGLMAVSPLSSLSSVEQFKVRYPEFSSVSNALISLVMDEASARIGDTWVDGDGNRARMLLTAHILTMEGEPGRTATGQGSAGTGLVKRDKVGDVETEFAVPSSSTGSSSTSAYASTFYGQQYLDLVRRNFPAVAVV